MAQLEFDMTALDKLFPRDEGFFLSTPESHTVEVPSIAAMPLHFTKLSKTETGTQRIVLARMEAKDAHGREADIRIMDAGEEGEFYLYSFDMAFKGLRSATAQVLLTDRNGNQLESVTPPRIDRVYMVNGVILYDVSMRDIGWVPDGRSRYGSQVEPIELFIGGYRQFEGGNIAIK